MLRHGECGAALLAAALVVGSLAAFAAGPALSDWPSFRGDPQLTGHSRHALREPLTAVWSFQAGMGVEATAAIAAGRVYVGAMDGILYCLQLDTGALVWKYEAGQPIKSSPAVADGSVYFGDEAGTLHAVDAATGRRRWKFQAEAAIASPPSVAAGRVMFGSNDNNLYALSAGDGKLSWKVSTAGYVFGSPAVLDQKDGPAVVSAGCDGILRVVRVKDGQVMKSVETGGYMGASPALAGRRAFVGTFENQFMAIDLDKGAVIWRYEHPERKFPFYASAAVTEDLVLVGGRDRELRALKQATGETVWSVSMRAKVDASPVVAGDRVVAGTTSGELTLHDLKTGAIVWQFDTGGALAASPSLGGGRLVIGNTAGTVFAFGGA